MAYVLDREGQPVPCEVPGELHIGGAGVARGYLNGAELTALKFLPDPFCGVALQEWTLLAIGCASCPTATWSSWAGSTIR